MVRVEKPTLSEDKLEVGQREEDRVARQCDTLADGAPVERGRGRIEERRGQGS